MVDIPQEIGSAKKEEVNSIHATTKKFSMKCFLPFVFHFSFTDIFGRSFVFVKEIIDKINWFTENPIQKTFFLWLQCLVPDIMLLKDNSTERIQIVYHQNNVLANWMVILIGAVCRYEVILFWILSYENCPVWIYCTEVVVFIVFLA